MNKKPKNIWIQHVYKRNNPIDNLTLSIKNMNNNEIYWGITGNTVLNIKKYTNFEIGDYFIFGSFAKESIGWIKCGILIKKIKKENYEYEIPNNIWIKPYMFKYRFKLKIYDIQISQNYIKEEIIENYNWNPRTIFAIKKNWTKIRSQLPYGLKWNE